MVREPFHITVDSVACGLYPCSLLVCPSFQGAFPIEGLACARNFFKVVFAAFLPELYLYWWEKEKSCLEKLIKMPSACHTHTLLRIPFPTGWMSNTEILLYTIWEEKTDLLWELRTSLLDCCLPLPSSSLFRKWIGSQEENKERTIGDRKQNRHSVRNFSIGSSSNKPQFNASFYSLLKWMHHLTLSWFLCIFLFWLDFFFNQKGSLRTFSCVWNPHLSPFWKNFL